MITLILLLSTFSCLGKFSFSQFLPASWTGIHTETVEHEYSVETKNPHVEIKNTTGNVVVKGWNRPQVVITATKQGDEDQLDATSIKIDELKDGLSIETTFLNGQAARVDYTTIMVPHSTALTITTHEGKIKVRSVHGTLNLTTAEGPVSIHDARASVEAHAPRGKIKLKQRLIKNDSIIFLDAAYDISFLATSVVQGKLDARTIKGTVSSELFVTLEPITTKLDNAAWSHMKRHIVGSLGTGDATITLQSRSGDIQILEY